MTNNYTISLWYKQTTFEGMDGYGKNVTNGAHCLFSRDADRGGLYFNIGNDPSNNLVNYGLGINNLGSLNDNYRFNGSMKGNSAANLNIWKSVAIKFENGSIKFFENGFLTKTEAFGKMVINEAYTNSILEERIFVL